MIGNKAKSCEKNMIVSNIVTLILGLVLTIEPTNSIKLLTAFVAICLMLVGAFQIFNYVKESKIQKMGSVSLIFGIVLISFGIIIFCNLSSLIEFITAIIGIILCIKSLFKIQFALNIKDIDKKWKYNLYLGLFTLILGILLIVNPFKSAVVFLRIIGTVLIIGSLVEIIESMIIVKNLDNYKELPFEEKK